MHTLLTKKELTKCNKRHLKKDQILFFESEVCKQVCIVEKGRIEITTFVENGEEIIYSILKEGQMFGQNLAFSYDKRYKGNVIAKEDSYVLCIEPKEFLKILRENEKFLIAYINHESEEAKSFNSRIKLLSFDSAENRLLFYLKEHNEEIKYSSITSLAKELNIQRETLSRLISKLSKKKIIVHKENIIKRP